MHTLDVGGATELSVDVHQLPVQMLGVGLQTKLHAAHPVPPWRDWLRVHRLAGAFLVNVTQCPSLEELRWMHRDEEGISVSGPIVNAQLGARRPGMRDDARCPWSAPFKRVVGAGKGVKRSS